MNKKIIFAGITILSLALAPMGIKSIVDKSIDFKKAELDNIGILLSIEKDEGYLNTKRDFKINVKDEVKFKEFFQDTFLENYPQYKFILNGFKQKNSKKVDEFFKGIVFKGNIQNSNINPLADIKVYTYLNSFSNKTMNAIKKEKKASDIILPLLEKEVFAFNLVFDNKSKLKRFSLKDINENIKIEEKPNTIETNFQILGNNIINNSTKNLISADVKFDKINMNIKTNKNANFTVDDLNYNINYKNHFENKGEMQLNSLKVDFDKNEGFALGKTSMFTEGNNNKGIYSADSKISTEKFYFNNGFSKITFDDFNINAHFDDLVYDNLKKLNKAYVDFETTNINSIYLSRKERKHEMKKASNLLFNEVTRVLNDGLSLNVNAKLLGLVNKKLNLKEVKLDIDAKLNKNDLKIETLNQFTALALLNVKARLEMFEEDFLSLTDVVEPNFIQTVSLYAKKENGKVLFDLDMKKGKIEVNGQKVN